MAVERVNRAPPGWELVDDEGERWHADAVVLAVPAPRLPRLIEEVAPRTAAAARRIAVASTALVALALPGGTPLPEQSGVLVASGERLRAKAITLSSRKWGRRGNVELVRLSYGRFGDDLARSAGDEDLLSWAAQDLATVFGVNVEPVDCHVHRWIDAMPQYGPGHRRAGRRAAGRPAADAGRRRRLSGRHRRACVCGGRDQGGGVAGHRARGTIEAMAKLDYDALNSMTDT